VSDAPDEEFVRLHILSPEEVHYDGRASWVQVPLEDGLIGIWPGHGALVGPIGVGEVEYAVGDDVRRLGVARGVLRVTEERCVVLVSRLLAEDAGDEPGAPGRDELFDALAEVLEEPFPEDESDTESEE
jgi:F0F1-type ATP synthase epsilon subunit